jgi:integrase
VPPLEPRETITLTREEARALQAVAEASDDVRSHLILFGLHMGMRPGELLGLRRRDIDWNNGIIQVRQTVAQLRRRGLVIQENRAKNRTSKAPVELTAGATQALVRAAAIQSQQIQAAGSAWEDHNLVFTNSIGRPLNPQWLRPISGCCSRKPPSRASPRTDCGTPMQPCCSRMARTRNSSRNGCGTRALA